MSKFAISIAFMLLASCGAPPAQTPPLDEEGQFPASRTNSGTVDRNPFDEIETTENTETGTTTVASGTKPVLVTKDIGHVPVSNRIEYACDQAKQIDGLSGAFLVGSIEDVWSADRLVTATVKLSSSSRNGECVSTAIESPRTTIMQIPSTVRVVEGNAGRGKVTIRFGMVRCTYRGGSDVDDPLHPFRANQAYKGMQYHWTGCSDGSLLSGDSWFYARFFSATIETQTLEGPIEVEAEFPVRYPIYSEEELGTVE